MIDDIVRLYWEIRFARKVEMEEVFTMWMLEKEFKKLSKSSEYVLLSGFIEQHNIPTQLLWTFKGMTAGQIITLLKEFIKDGEPEPLIAFLMSSDRRYWDMVLNYEHEDVNVKMDALLDKNETSR